MSCPAALRNSVASLRMFSSMRKRILDYFGKRSVVAGFYDFSGIMKSGLDMRYGELRIGIFNNVFSGFSRFKHFKGKVYHYSGVLKTGLSVAYIWINAYIFSIVHRYLSLLYNLYKDTTAILGKSQAISKKARGILGQKETSVFIR